MSQPNVSRMSPLSHFSLRNDLDERTACAAGHPLSSPVRASHTLRNSAGERESGGGVEVARGRHALVDGPAAGRGTVTRAARWPAPRGIAPQHRTQ